MKRFCKTCGAEIGEDTNICSICGSVYGKPQANDTTVLNSNTNFATQTGNETTVLNQNPQFSASQKNTSPNFAANHSYQTQNSSKSNPASNPHFQNPYMQQNNNVNNLNNQNSATSNNSQYYNPPVTSQNGFGQGNNYNAPNNYNFPNNPASPYQRDTGFTTVPTQQKKKLSTGAIIGIVIGAIAVITIVALIVVVATSSSNSTDAEDNYSYYDDGSTADENFMIDHGSIIGANYSNPAMDLSVDLPSTDWRFLSNQEIYDNYNGGSGYVTEFDEEGFVSARNAAETMHLDMCMVDSVNAVIIYSMYSELTALSGQVSVDEYLMSTANSNLTSEDPGYVTESDIYSYIIAGNEYRVCETPLEVNNVEFTMTFAVRKNGDYVYGLIIMNSPDYDINSATYYMDMFY